MKLPRAWMPGAIIVLAAGLPSDLPSQPRNPEFEVASVKTSAGGDFGFVPHRSGDRVSIHMTHIGTVICYAFTIPYSRVVGYERSPIAYDWYDIDAEAAPGASDSQIRLMFQSLLESRFQLKTHRETRDLSTYDLTVAKGKPKLTAASADEVMKIPIEGRNLETRRGDCSTTAWRDGDRLVCHAAPMDKIVSTIRGLMSGPVVDLTGLSGVYDVNLRFVSDRAGPRPDAEPAPTLAVALQEELGLKLEKHKGPVEVLVIDRLAKPSAN